MYTSILSLYATSPFKSHLQWRMSPWAHLLKRGSSSPVCLLVMWLRKDLNFAQIILPLSQVVDVHSSVNGLHMVWSILQLHHIHSPLQLLTATSAPLKCHSININISISLHYFYLLKKCDSNKHTFLQVPEFEVMYYVTQLFPHMLGNSSMTIWSECGNFYSTIRQVGHTSLES